MRKLLFVIALTFIGNSYVKAQTHQVHGKNLNAYKWYGKRFDWVLDLYSRQPFHKDSIHLFIRQVGSGKDTFIVIHGGFGAEHSYMLDGLLPVANKAHLIFYDQRGSLRSPCADSVISVRNHVHDIERIRKAFGIERIGIIAHSMGTWLALRYLQEFPQHVGKLILISSLPVKQTDSTEAKEIQSYQQSIFEKISEPQGKLWRIELVKHGIDTAKYFQRNYSEINSSMFMHMNLFWAAAGQIYDFRKWELVGNGSNFLYKRRAARAVTDMSEFWNFTESINAHSYPILFIKAAGDYLSPKILKEQVMNLKNVTYYEISNAGHNPWIEQPARFKNVMRKAISK